jgi:flagellar protein FlaI
MNVPSIMLSGLDLIIVEHRFYDRKKGTIRRISEIAEVYGAMDGKPRTQTIFQRDPARDVLERTLVDSKYLKMLQNFTGTSKENIESELKARKIFLERLLGENIRTIGEVSERAKQYLIDKAVIGSN